MALLNLGAIKSEGNIKKVSARGQRRIWNTNPVKEFCCLYVIELIDVFYLINIK